MTTFRFVSGMGGSLGAIPTGGEDVMKLALSTDTQSREAYEQMQTTLGQDIKKQGEAMEKAIQKEAIQGAVLNTVISTSLMAIPVCGQAISACFSLLTGYLSKKYADKLKSYVEKKSKELAAFQEAQQKRLTDALNVAYKDSYKKGIELSLSYQHLELSADPQSEITRPKWETDYEYMGDLGFLKKLTGESMYDEGKKRMDEMVASTKTAVLNGLNPVIAKTKEAGFRARMAKSIAMAARENPAFLAICKAQGVPVPSKYLGPGEPQPDTRGPIPTVRKLMGMEPRPVGTMYNTEVLKGGEVKAIPSTSATAIPEASGQLHMMEPDVDVDKATEKGQLIRYGTAAAAVAILGFTLLR